MIRLEDFLPDYPELSDPFFQQKIFNKEEFYKYRGDGMDASGYLNHQIVGAHFMSPHTEYDGLLVFHQQGVGKTCFAHAVAEELRASGKYKRCIVIARGKDLLASIMRSFVYSCMKDEEFKKKKFRDSNLEIRALKKALKSFYSFNTFIIFARELETLSDEVIISRFSDTLIVVDEVHNVAAKDEGIDGVYTQIHRLFHLASNCKKLIMSATPMSDEVTEIATIMNLILSRENQLPIGAAFEQQFLEKEEDGTFSVRPEGAIELRRRFAGKISYLLARAEDVNIIYSSD